MITLASINLIYHKKNLRQVLNIFGSKKSSKFRRFFQPAHLSHPARLLGRLEYLAICVLTYVKSQELLILKF